MMLDGHFRVHSMYAIHHNIPPVNNSVKTLLEVSKLNLRFCSTEANHSCCCVLIFVLVIIIYVMDLHSFQSCKELFDIEECHDPRRTPIEDVLYHVDTGHQRDYDVCLPRAKRKDFSVTMTTAHPEHYSIDPIV
eukprot:10836-Heterococcus_DN1.PRE.1